MPLTSANVGRPTGRKSASLFDAGQTSPVGDSAPSGVPSGSPGHSAVVSDPGSTGMIDNQVGNNAPGAVPTSFNVRPTASGSGAGTPAASNDSPEFTDTGDENHG
jgi:hypothetical protein